MVILESEKATFEAMVRRHFTFLEVAGLIFSGVDFVDEGPRDSYLTAKYRRGSHRIDIAWAPIEMSLGVLVRVEADGLSSRERYIHAEPFIEFISEGAVGPVVPQIYPGMSIAGIEQCMGLRAKVFADGIAVVVEKVAARLNMYYPEICNATIATIRDYHRWYRSEN